MVRLYADEVEVDVKWWSFPGGERSCRIESEIPFPVFEFIVEVNFRSSDDIIDMALLVNAIRNMGHDAFISLSIPYMPFARQDRVMTTGEPFALQVMVQFIKMCNFDSINVLDPHSDVLAGMFEPGLLKIVDQTQAWTNVIKDSIARNENAYLVSPDAGALKKIFKLANATGLPVIEAGKVRDVKTGEIVGTTVNSDPYFLGNITLIVVDDICDGGRTFIELANALKYKFGSRINKLVLCVTHGIFSKGLDCLDCYDQIYTINNMSKCNLGEFNVRKQKNLDLSS